MKFWKMQGCGNDFIVIDGRHDERHDDSYSEQVERLCSRKFSVGADGFIIVKNSQYSDIKMVYYNSDGSRGEMCGNGIRCFSKFVIENKIIRKSIFTVETLGGEKEIFAQINERGLVSSVSVNMGYGNFEPHIIPVHNIFHSKQRFVDESITIIDKEFKVSSMLMGVPHTIIFTDEDLSIDNLEKYGSAIENHDVFPKKTNVNFVRIIDDNTISIQTWERGCGYTYGCGTGMTASAIIANCFGYVNTNVKVISFGGEVTIKIRLDGAFMEGNAIKTFEGYL